MTATPASLKILAPEFCSESDPRLQFFIDQAAVSVPASVWKTKTDQATLFLSAHLLTLAKRGGSVAGPITSEKVGDLSRNYGTTAATDGSNLNSTSWGQEFQRLKKGISVSPLVTC